MFMAVIEDIENLIFKCEKLIDANTIKAKRNKKEERTLKKVIENYEVSEDNKIVYSEITNRYTDLVGQQEILKDENKYLKVVIRKLNSLLNTDNVIEEAAQTEDNTDNIVYEVEQE